MYAQSDFILQKRRICVQLLTEDLICLTKASVDRGIFPHRQKAAFQHVFGWSTFRIIPSVSSTNFIQPIKHFKIFFSNIIYIKTIILTFSSSFVQLS